MNAAVIGWIIKLISGAVGGNLAGAAMQDKSLGTVGNTIAGLVGGGIGGAILQVFGFAQAGGLDLGTVLTQIASGGVGGAIVMVILAVFKGATATRA